MRSVEELCEVLRERGLKVTPQRRLIFEALHQAPEHPTADDIYHAVREVMPNMSLATVYHTLNDLAAMGELVELDLGEGKSRYDTSTAGHPHLVCQVCRRIEDVLRDLDCVELLPKETHGYRIERWAMVFYGRCPECQS